MQPQRWWLEAEPWILRLVSWASWRFACPSLLGFFLAVPAANAVGVFCGRAAAGVSPADPR